MQGIIVGDINGGTRDYGSHEGCLLVVGPAKIRFFLQSPRANGNFLPLYWGL